MILQIESLSKHFGGVAALSAVSFSMERGQRYALLGENGAGKSTLVRILAGEYRADSGQVLLDGARFAPASPHDARSAGVMLVPQELSFCPNLPVAENMLLGELPSRAGWLRRNRMRQEAVWRLERLGLSEIDPDALMGTLSTGQAQAVQIAAAVSRHPRLLLLDEPTSALSRGESLRLARILAQLREERVSVLYVSHRMEEIFGSAESAFPPCDAYTVLRDGRHVESGPLEGKQPGEIVRAMIGRELQHEQFAHLGGHPGSAGILSAGGQDASAPRETRLRLEKLSDAAGRFSNIDLEVRGGEVLGIAGLVGSGRTEMARSVIGLRPGARGNVFIDEELYPRRSVRESLRRGLVYLTEDRKREGLISNLSCAANWSLPFLNRFVRGGVLLKRGDERRQAASALSALQVKSVGPDAPVRSLSGGNQQKVLFARWLSVQPPPGVLIFDEPTRGVDVGSKAEIHRLISALSQRGAAVVVISSDLPELLALSSRLAVMRRGSISGILSRAEMSEQAAGKLMVGV